MKRVKCEHSCMVACTIMAAALCVFGAVTIVAAVKTKFCGKKSMDCKTDNAESAEE